METFTIQNLSFTYPEQSKKALDGITMHVERGGFLVLCGPSGCGKSTLLRQLKSVLTPRGRREGEILFEGRPLAQVDQREQSWRIGFVQQSPDSQIVTDKVWHELAFGLESLGCGAPAIRRRVAETASFFGMESWFYQNTAQLSGGQKQLLNLASVMVMSPSVLILDEPTGQLDPIAASDFLAVLGRINRELGVTVILTEHRLELALPLADSAAVMERGGVLCRGTPAQVGAALKRAGHPMLLAMPAATRVWAGVETAAECPVTVREGRAWLAEFAGTHPLRPLPEPPPHSCSRETAVSAEGVWFKYGEDATDAVKGLSLDLKKGEFLALLGGNGAGKTTCLKLLAGLLRPYRGEVKTAGRVGMLPQDPQTLLGKATLRQDLLEPFRDGGESRETRESRVAASVSLCRLEELLDRHPYDLSGGEQQRAALAKVLLSDPEILLMDEPTKGLDAQFKQVFAEILQTLLRRGTAILMVSHDIEFCARYAHRCALFFDGGIVAEGTPRAFFSGNSFYTTSANRMARELLPEAVTAEDLIAVCGGSPPPPAAVPEEAGRLPEPEEDSADWVPAPLPRWRKRLAALSGGGVLLLLIHALQATDLTALMGAEGIAAPARAQGARYLLLILCLLVLAAAVSRRAPRGKLPERTPPGARRLSKRTAASAGLILLLIPLTLFAGETCLAGRSYYLISLLILLECMAPFFLIFERRRPKARELTVIAVLCALGTAGRAALFMLSEFKPVMALVIVSGVALGGEAGFLVGAATMLVSNMLFSQGPWVPWQMFAMGLIGFSAGVLFRKGLLRRSRGALALFGALSAVLIYGGIMNPAAALMASARLNGKILLAYYLSGFPMDCIHAAATALFLWFAAEPLLEKLDRIKVKYGLAE